VRRQRPARHQPVSPDPGPNPGAPVTCRRLGSETLTFTSNGSPSAPLPSKQQPAPSTPPP
ncbi:MAG TPA: hypothetical protein VKC57_06935, partial [Ktedonobacterales bacterium]|nr:hypothetical protein [Ktedonobacterales bacterium]